MIQPDKRIFLLLIFFCCYLTGNSQSGIAEFLVSATHDKELEIYNNQISYLSGKPYRLAPIRELEYRSQTNELGANKQEHAIRISPANPLEIMYTKKVFNSYQNLLSLQRELALNQLLTQRYLLAVDLLYLNELKEIRNKLVNTTNGRISILEQQNSSGFFDAEEYVKLKLEQMEDLTDLKTIEFQIDQKGKEVIKLTGKDREALHLEEWTYSNAISIEQMEHLVDSLLQRPLFTTLFAYSKEKVNFAENEYKLKKWDINPGFVQGSYRHYQELKDQSPLGFNFGVTIPVFNPNKGRIAKQRLEILEAENELVLEKQEAEEELESLVLTLKSYLQRYKSLEEQMNSYDVEKLLSAVNILNKENPAVRLKFDAQLLKLQKVQLEVKKEIYKTYIAILSKTELLNQTPLVNFLSDGLEPL